MILLKNVKDYVFVAIQLLLLCIYIFPIDIIQVDLPVWLKYIGLIFSLISLLLAVSAVLQLNTNLSPFPTPLSSGRLITNGVFRIARHPIYTGIFGICVGYGIYSDSLYKFLISVALLLLFYYKSEYEEELLMFKYPTYSDYKKRTGRFFPKFFK